MVDTWTSVPPTLVRYRIPASLLATSVRALREGSAGYRETVILWQGRVLDETTALVTRLHVPHQFASLLHFDVPIEERLRLLDEVSAAGEFILVQLHTHPRRAFHSDVDDRLAIPRHTGALSIVVADFARYWDGDLLQTSVNRHLGAGEWEELGPDEVSRLLVIGD
jgi:hypothetical protein